MELPPPLVVLLLLHNISPVSFTVGETKKRTLLTDWYRRLCAISNSQPSVSAACITNSEYDQNGLHITRMSLNTQCTPSYLLGL